MANELGPFLQGKHLTAVTIVGLVFTDGVMTLDGTAKNIYATIGSVDASMEVQSSDTRPIWEENINMLPHSFGESMRLTCLKRSALPTGPLAGDTSANILDDLVRATASKRFLIAWTEAGVVHSAYYTLSRWNGGVRNRENNTTECDFTPFKPAGIAQMTRTEAE